jgi:hypothetical protein
MSERLIELFMEESVPYSSKGTAQQKQKALEILAQALTDIRAGRHVPWTRDYERIRARLEQLTGIKMRSLKSYM